MVSERKVVGNGIVVIYGVNGSRPSTADRCIPVFSIAGRFRAGETIKFIADDYEISEEQVEQAIRFALDHWTL